MSEQRFAEHKADVAVVVAYGLLLPEAILNGTRYGCYNGHASLLPRWRGAAPIQRAIMAGDEKTGMMVMKMDKGLDTGAVAITSEVAIGENMTGGELHDKLMHAGAKAMAEAMVKLEMGDLPLTPQPDEGVLYASKIDKSETRIDFSRMPPRSTTTSAACRPFPAPGSSLRWSGKPERVKVLGGPKRRRHGTPGAADRRSRRRLRLRRRQADQAAEGRRQAAGGRGFPARHSICLPARGFPDASLPHDRRI
jgi:methionyl-tRNA formyltransferase